jgi:MFS family permease
LSWRRSFTGAGFGSAFLGALRTVSQLAEPHQRAALLSAVYLVSYLAFSVPALVAGLLTTHIGLRETSFGYGGFVALVAVGTLAFERLAGRQGSDAEGPAESVSADRLTGTYGVRLGSKLDPTDFGEE